MSARQRVALSLLIFVLVASQGHKLAYSMPSIGHIDAPERRGSINTRLIKVIDAANREQTLITYKCTQQIGVIIHDIVAAKLNIHMVPWSERVSNRVIFRGNHFHIANVCVSRFFNIPKYFIVGDAKSSYGFADIFNMETKIDRLTVRYPFRLSGMVAAHFNINNGKSRAMSQNKTLSGDLSLCGGGFGTRFGGSRGSDCGAGSGFGGASRAFHMAAMGFGSLREFRGCFSRGLCSVRTDPGRLIRAIQEPSLADRDDRQEAGKPREKLGVISDPLIRRYWRDMLGGALTGLGCLLAIVMLNRGYPRLPGQKGEDDKNG